MLPLLPVNNEAKPLDRAQLVAWMVKDSPAFMTYFELHIKGLRVFFLLFAQLFGIFFCYFFLVVFFQQQHVASCISVLFGGDDCGE